MKQINNSVLDWLAGPFSKRPDQFDQDDWIRLHQANEDTLYYVQNHEEYLSKKALEESQPIFDPIKFKTSDRFRALRIWTWLSLQDMADMLGVSRTTATKYEREGFKDGLKQNQIDLLVTYIGDVLYKSNKSPTHAESLRFMIRATDKVAKEDNPGVEIVDLKDIPVGSKITEDKPKSNRTLLKYQEHFRNMGFEHLEVVNEEVLLGRLDQLTQAGRKLSMQFIENLEEVAVIHEQLLINNLGENLAQEFIQEDPPEFLQETVEKILNAKKLKTEDFLITELNRMSLLNYLYKYLIPKYPTSFTDANKGSKTFDELHVTNKGGKKNG
jgi:DNA-binding XRE family transcriptional regulator